MILGGRGDHQGRGEQVGLVAGDMTRRVIGLAIKVHQALGPGLLEQVYEDCLCHELARGGLAFRRQVMLPLMYEGIRLPRGVSEFLCVRLVQSHPPLGTRL